MEWLLALAVATVAGTVGLVVSSSSSLGDSLPDRKKVLRIEIEGVVEGIDPLLDGPLVFRGPPATVRDARAGLAREMMREAPVGRRL